MTDSLSPKPFRRVDAVTDMAVEARDLVRGEDTREIPGVKVTERRERGVSVTVVEILEEEAERLMGKPRGRYVTLDVPTFKERDPDLKEGLTAVLTEYLKPFIPADPALTVLVVGLGNWNATPDALGPRVVDQLLVTRHLRAVVPEDIRDRMRSVAAVAPGVLGTTGIETVDVIRGIVREVQPDLVIAIDALAARNLDRLVGSVQIADTGIHPGSGVGNRRQGVTQSSVGVPVVAVGVCTVVPAIGIVHEALRRLTTPAASAPLFAAREELAPADHERLVHDVLGARLGDLMVTPKEIDTLVDDMADVLVEALNRALQPDLDRSEWA